MNYIKMCITAESYLWNEGYVFPFGSVFISSDTGSPFSINWRGPWPGKGNNVPLWSVEQLMGMVDHTPILLTSAIFGWAAKHYKYVKKFSNQMLWLAFVMHELHGKKWDDVSEIWV